MAAMLGKARHKVALFERWPTIYGLCLCPESASSRCRVIADLPLLGMGGHWFETEVYARSYSCLASAVRNPRPATRAPELEVSVLPGFVMQYQPFLESELPKSRPIFPPERPHAPPPPQK